MRWACQHREARDGRVLAPENTKYTNTDCETVADVCLLSINIAHRDLNPAEAMKTLCVNVQIVCRQNGKREGNSPRVFFAFFFSCFI